MSSEQVAAATPDLSVRRLDASCLEAMAGLAARAMQDNPTHVAVWGDDAGRRERHLRDFFRLVLMLQLPRGALWGAWVGAELIGMAGVFRPGQCQLSRSTLLRAGWRMPLQHAPMQLLRMLRWQAAWHGADPAQLHWHLGPVAVLPSSQGRGLGSQLVQRCCRVADEAGGSLYLETDKAINVRFYRRLGFILRQEMDVLGVRHHLMWRAAGGEAYSSQTSRPESASGSSTG